MFLRHPRSLISRKAADKRQVFMKARLAAGVTSDFIHAASPEARLGTLLVSPLFFLCCLLTRIPRRRESRTEYSRVMGERRLFTLR